MASTEAYVVVIGHYREWKEFVRNISLEDAKKFKLTSSMRDLRGLKPCFYVTLWNAPALEDYHLILEYLKLTEKTARK